MWCESSIFLVPYANSFVYNFQIKFSCGLLAMANLSSSYFFTNIKHKILFENLMYTPACLKVGNPSPSPLPPRCTQNVLLQKVNEQKIGHVKKTRNCVEAKVSKIFFLTLFIHKCQLLPIKIVLNAQLFNVQQTTNLTLMYIGSCFIRVDDNWIPHKSCILNIEHFILFYFISWTTWSQMD
jgi:hypothetical protein